MERHYGKQVTIVFDGYQHGPSTKDPTHQQRKIRGVGPQVKFMSSAVISHKKDIFLSNDSNKNNFILMLAEKFSSCGFFVHHAHTDADLLIVRSALERAQSRSTVAIGDGTDLLILLCYHNDLQSRFSIYLKLRIWNIKRTQEKLGIGICRNILVLHAILGCDTTSRIFTSGKGMALKKMVSDNNFTRAIAVLNKLPNVVTKQDIIKGERKPSLLCIMAKAHSTI